MLRLRCAIASARMKIRAVIVAHKISFIAMQRRPLVIENRLTACNTARVVISKGQSNSMQVLYTLHSQKQRAGVAQSV
jgi:hypothetical protein